MRSYWLLKIQQSSRPKEILIPQTSMASHAFPYSRVNLTPKNLDQSTAIHEFSSSSYKETKKMLMVSRQSVIDWNLLIRVRSLRDSRRGSYESGWPGGPDLVVGVAHRCEMNNFVASGYVSSIAGSATESAGA